MEKTKDSDNKLMFALVIIALLLVITICGCAETLGGFGRDITYFFDGYQMARQQAKTQNQMPAGN